MSETIAEEIKRLERKKRVMSNIATILFVLTPPAMLILGIWLGNLQGRVKQRLLDMHEATERGAAEYYNDENNVKQWRWKSPC